MDFTSLFFGKNVSMFFRESGCAACGQSNDQERFVFNRFVMYYYNA